MKVLKYLGKFAAAAITAVIILSIIFSAYYLVPVRVDNPEKNTDYKWEPNAVWMRMEEGISAGKIDANGFNNTEVTDDPDILILGSSHMEAANVPQDSNTASYLSEMLDGKLSVYNMSISGHTFPKICQYLPQTMKAFTKTPKYILIETSATDISENDAQSILNHDVPKTSVNHNKFLDLLQRLPFFRVVYYQMDGGLIKKLSDAGGTGNKAVDPSDKDEAETEKADETPYNEVFGYLQDIQDEYRTKIIIVYHPTEQLNADGTVTFPHDASYDPFKNNAEAHGIVFADATDAFEERYNKDYQLPHGFINGKIGAGHLNSAGHYAAAKTLYNAITDAEEAKDADN